MENIITEEQIRIDKCEGKIRLLEIEIEYIQSVVKFKSAISQIEFQLTKLKKHFEEYKTLKGNGIIDYDTYYEKHLGYISNMLIL